MCARDWLTLNAQLRCLGHAQAQSRSAPANIARTRHGRSLHCAYACKLAIGSALSAPPSFVLSPLSRVDPMPGAVWRDRLFCAHFADSHVDNTELLGHDQKKGGDMAPLLRVMAFAASQTRDERKDELAQVGVGEEQMRALDKAMQIWIVDTHIDSPSAWWQRSGSLTL